MHVIIAGAGLGGLTFALAAARQGLEVTVLEQAERLGEVGAGIQLSANGTRVLHGLGLGPALEAVAFRPGRGEVRHYQSGAVLSSRELGESSVRRFGFPYYHLHRADLHAALVATVEERQAATICLGERLTGFSQRGGAVTVHTEAGTRFSVDVLVGCDGIHSKVRECLFGADAPRFTGCVAWRTTIPVERLPPRHVRPVASNWIGRGGHFVHYYVRRGELVNCVGCLDCEAWTEESWSARGQPSELARDFQGWHPDLQVLIGAAESCFRWGLFDRDPMPRWSAGAITLLGDACHPMLPFMAQGAVMAIEDASVLARLLGAVRCGRLPVPVALERYESLRQERTATVQRMARANLEFFHDVDAATEERLNGHRAAHEWLYGYDATTLPVDREA